MTANLGYVGLEAEKQKNEYEIHVCTNCKNIEICKKGLACSTFKSFLNPKLKSPNDNRIPSKELYQ